MKKHWKRHAGLTILALSLALLLSLLPVFADDTGETENVEAVSEAPTPEAVLAPTPESESAPAPEPEPAPTPEAETAPTPDDEAGSEDQDEPSTEPVADEPEVTPEPSDTEAPEEEAPSEPVERVTQITAITCKGPAAARMSYKLAREAILSGLPASADATLSDGVDASEAELPLMWTCADYDAEKTQYVFVSAQAESDYPLAEGVSMPAFILTIADEVSGDYTYRLDASNALTITGWNGTDEELTVPEKLDGLPVAHIAAEAFRGKSWLTKLALPKGVQSIGARAFADCPALGSLSLPDSLETDVPVDAIAGDDALEALILTTDLNARLSAADVVERDIPGEKEGEVCTLRVKLPMEVTDIQVNDSTFALACDFRVDGAHEIRVAEKGELLVAPGRTLTLSGPVQNQGALTNAGTIIDCGNAISGNAPQNQGEGRVSTDHAWQDGQCAVCGAEQPEPTPTPEAVTLNVRYSGSALTKVYDQTTGTKAIANKPKKSDFSLSGADPAHDVQIEKLTLVAFDAASAGERKVTVKATLTGADKDLYRVGEFTIPGVITPRPLVIKAPAITPGGKNPLTKTFGASDPRALPGVVKKGCLLPGDEALLTGALAREPGEDVGRYKMLPGTVSAGKNYAVEMEDYWFTIAPKSINSSDVGLVTLKPQRYTGKAVKPAVTLRIGTNKLVEGKDYSVVFSNNIEPGNASVFLKGIGNFAGQRMTTFRILNTSGGSSGSGGGSSGGSKGSSGGSSGSSGGWSGGYSAPSGSAASDAAPEKAEASDSCQLLLDGTDFGAVLFDGYDVPQPFEARVDEDAHKVRTLTITAKPLRDPETGEELPFVEDGARRDYGELHLRVSPEMAETLRKNDYAEIIYRLEDAHLRLPLEALAEKLLPDERPVAGDAETEPSSIQVESYDIWIEQVQMALLSEDEGLALEDHRPLAPVYRLWIRAVPVTEANDTSDASDANGLEYGGGERILVSLPGYLEGTKLSIQLPLDLRAASEGAQTLSVPVQKDPESADAYQFVPATFIESDDALYTGIDPAADGLYAVVVYSPAEPDD